jgi:hypothetical protein
MDLGNIALLLIVGLGVAAAAAVIGFMIPAPIQKVDGESSGNIEKVILPDDFSPQLKKIFSGSDGAEMQAPDCLVAWGRGRISSHLPIFGRVWLPLTWTLYLVPGTMFIMHNRITWFGRVFIRGGEEFRHGKGNFFLGRKPVENPYLDETERALVWLYSIWLAPGSLANHPHTQWSLVDQEIELRVADEGLAPLTFKLTQDESEGTLTKIVSTRKGSRTGGDYPFIAQLAAPKSFDSSTKIPSRWIADWDNDVYLKLDLAGLRGNADIEEVLQGGIEELHL